jgi:hypothetical protein
MILKYILYGSIWSNFGAKNSKSKCNQNVPQIPNCFDIAVTTKYKCNTFCIHHNKNALKYPGKIYRGLFLNFFNNPEPSKGFQKPNKLCGFLAKIQTRKIDSNCSLYGKLNFPKIRIDSFETQSTKIPLIPSQNYKS